MNLHLLYNECVTPALAFLPPVMDSVPARIILGATTIQESDLRTRRQTGGPAVSFWQFEKIGIKEVLINPKTAAIAADACKFHNCEPSVNAVYEKFKLPEGDILAAIFARLNYWRVRDPLPKHNTPVAESAYWLYYKNTWRPGKPHLDRWPRSFWRAYGAIEG